MPPASPLDALVRPPVGWVAALLWGAIWGSFWNLAIFRIGLWVETEIVTSEALPDDATLSWLDGERDHLRWIGRALASLLRPPRSFCPRCQATLRAVDNIPLVSWFVLGGRCRSCGAPIARRYPLVESLGVALAAAVYWRFVVAAPAASVVQAGRFFVYFGFGGTLVVLSAIDLETMLLPDAILYPAIPAFFVAGRLLPDVAPLDAAIGLAAGWGLFAGLAWVWRAVTGREGLGAGDAKLAALIGGLLGWRSLPYTLVGASVLGLVTTVPLAVAAWLRARRAARAAGHDPGALPSITRMAVPFGPQLAAAALGYLLVGRALHAQLVSWVIGE